MSSTDNSYAEPLMDSFTKTFAANERFYKRSLRAVYAVTAATILFGAGFVAWESRREHAASKACEARGGVLIRTVGDDTCVALVRR